jgi:uncharacterized protein YdeI (YjbR/CyaY-like superfamily)
MGEHKVIGLLKAIRTELGKGPGDKVMVTLDIDRGERTVTVPDDLRIALADAGLSERFDALSFSHRREYVEWIGQSKKADTRGWRIAQTLERLG